MDKIYFDNAATTKIDSSVLSTINNVMQENYGNPSSTHSFGRASRTIVEKARKSIAEQFKVTAGEIFFTSGGTESDNMVLISAVRDLKVETIITSKIEHHAVLNVVKYLEKKYLIKVIYVEIDKNGCIDYQHLEQILDSNKSKTLVSLMHINNEIGSVLDIKLVGEICKKYNAIFHSDTVQTIGRYDMDLSLINIDFIVGSAHKFHGPKGIGFLYVNKKLNIEPIVIGGSQERGLRAGTESVHNISGMETALLLAYNNLENDKKYIKDLKNHFIKQSKELIPNIKFNANCDDYNTNSYTVLNVCLPVAKEKSILLEFNLDLKGIACSRGSACQSGSSKGSHVLNHILEKEDLEKPSLRFSFSKYNTIEEVDIVVNTLKLFIESN
ncbi:cysteine desulfurase [Flavobacteriaceae bacterium]|nr:cysteine desulfurase [Flavobacteriaceae bacterium]